MENFVIVLCSAVLIVGSSMLTSAHQSSHVHHNHHQHDHGHTSPRRTSPAPHHHNDGVPATFSVTDFGAVGDGIKDDAKAFDKAWEAACKSGSSSGVTVTAPTNKTYLVSQIEFHGPCKPTSITFEILGNVVAPLRSQWKKKHGDAWIQFTKIKGLTVDGNRIGSIDGRGESWWKHSTCKHCQTFAPEKIKASTKRPTAMRFSNCTELQIRALNYKNSQNNHISLRSCHNAIITDLNITAPQKSPNTDGIDISHSTSVQVRHSIIATGDDCVAINPGTSNVKIYNITCGPGHGISIGSLGIKGRRDEVEDVHVQNCTFKGSTNGARIKTWQGGSGFARNISFTDLIFKLTDNPVIIDQYYCPHKKCSNKTSAVEITNVRYAGLRGTSICKKDAVNLSCSKSVPCTNITISDLNIKSVYTNGPAKAKCENVHGVANNIISPPMDCLLI